MRRANGHSLTLMIQKKKRFLRADTGKSPQ